MAGYCCKNSEHSNRQPLSDLRRGQCGPALGEAQISFKVIREEILEVAELKPVKNKSRVEHNGQLRVHVELSVFYLSINRQSPQRISQPRKQESLDHGPLHYHDLRSHQIVEEML